MPQVARRARPNFSSSQTMYAPEVAGHYAAVDLEVGPVQLRPDNRVYPCVGDTAANAVCHGFVVQAHKAGEPTVIHGIGSRIGYGDAATPLPPAAALYVDTVAGRLNTDPTAGGTRPVAFVIGATQDIMVVAPTL
jgi:hypothetical protein